MIFRILSNPNPSMNLWVEAIQVLICKVLGGAYYSGYNQPEKLGGVGKEG